MFEAARDRERDEIHKRSIAKSVEMQKVMQQNLLMAEERKQVILKQQELAE
jgi:hypothetical protein